MKCLICCLESKIILEWYIILKDLKYENLKLIIVVKLRKCFERMI